MFFMFETQTIVFFVASERVSIDDLNLNV